MSEKSLSQMTKAELVQYIQTLDAQIQAMKAELDAIRPNTDPNGRKLNLEKADQIRRLFASGTSKNALSLRYQVSRDTIDCVLSGKIYKANYAPIAAAQPQAKQAEVARKTKATKANKAAPAQNPDEQRNRASNIRKLAHEAHARAQAKQAEVAQITEAVEAKPAEVAQNESAQ